MPLRVDQQGPACHTERPNCFYNAIRDGEVDVISDLQAPSGDQPQTNVDLVCGYKALQNDF